jgi:hypothetical protein
MSYRQELGYFDTVTIFNGDRRSVHVGYERSLGTGGYARAYGPLKPREDAWAAEQLSKMYPRGLGR